MDFELFQKKLRELIVECGGLAESDFRVEFYARPQERSFHPRDPQDRNLDALRAVRSVTPIKIEFTVHTAQAGRWHHTSGDDRRLHPDLRHNAPDLREAKQLPEYISQTEDGWEDRRRVELQPDGERVLRDPVTRKAYDISTGSEKPLGWDWADRYKHDD